MTEEASKPKRAKATKPVAQSGNIAGAETEPGEPGAAKKPRARKAAGSEAPALDDVATANEAADAATPAKKPRAKKAAEA